MDAVNCDTEDPGTSVKAAASREGNVTGRHATDTSRPTYAQSATVLSRKTVLPSAASAGCREDTEATLTVHRTTAENGKDASGSSKRVGSPHFYSGDAV